MNNYDRKIDELIKILVDSPYNIKEVPQILLNDKDFISKLLESSNKYNLFFFAYVSDELKEDKEFMLEIIKDTPEMLSLTNLQNDKSFMLAILKKNIEFADYIPESLKNDEDIMSLAIESSGDKLKEAPEQIKNNKQIVLKAIESSPLMFKFASQQLKDDKEVVSKAVGLNHNNLIFASNRLRGDKDFALDLIKLDHKVLTYLSSDIKSDKKIALAAYRKNKDSIKLFSQELIKEINKIGISKDNIEKYLEMHVLKENLTSELEANEPKNKKLKI